MNLDQDFFQVSKLGEDQKKRSSPEMEHLFSPNSGKDQKKKEGLNQKWNTFSTNSSTDLRLDAHQSQIIGGDADEDHTQIVGGDTVKLLGGYIPPSPRVLAPLHSGIHFGAQV